MDDPQHDSNAELWSDELHHANYMRPGRPSTVNGIYSGVQEPQQYANMGQPPQVGTPSQQQSENYSFLSVGHGSYLKLFHNPDETVKYNNYELFSNNSFIPHHVVNPQAPVHQAQSNLDAVFYQDCRHQQEIAAPVNSVIINQLVGNWVPNVSGTYSPFGETPQCFNNAPAANEMSSPPQQPAMAIPSTSFGPMPSPSNRVLLPERPEVVGEPVVAFTTEQPIANKSEVKKPRMVAEVKPMRMSYSDVVSKNVWVNKKDAPNEKTLATGAGGPNANSSKTPKLASEKSKSSHGNGTNKKSGDDKDLYASKKDRKANSKDDPSLGNGIGSAMQTDKKGGNSSTEDDCRDTKGGASDGTDGKSSKKKGTVTSRNARGTMDGSNSSPRGSHGNRNPMANVNASNRSGDESIGYYNVTKAGLGGSAAKDLSQSERKSSKKSKSSYAMRSINCSGAKTDKANTSSLHSSKRGPRSKQSSNKELIMDVLKKWCEYLCKVIWWLISLVTDVVILSCGIAWERLGAGLQYACISYRVIRTELRNNSGLPYIWAKNAYKRLDTRFGKDSRWALWRGIFNKKKAVEPPSDFYKNGRLPQTGDEAMYSLLNCKGKDAYSILGVTVDCTQEQIRKHYKKIAVLVHPDKNKQPGAEEGFKILQRAFELIGEPENRRAYDQSLAEALNAEKAWSELNDLLTQLHTKIAEAANTIRCSSCSLRHPRKSTGRPQYSARECSSCKIRHPAREGDIWAETSLFGLRWKYLAIMEGTVYDITEWANCQKGALSHLQPNSHVVQYRIVLGGQQQPHQSNQQQKNYLSADKDRLQKENMPHSEPNLDDFLNNLYGAPPGQQTQNPMRRRNKKN